MTSQRRQRYRDELRADALRVGLEQLETHGLRELSVASIAKELGMRAPSLYHYFASRDDLLSEIAVSAAEDLRSRIEAAWVAHIGGPAPDRLRAVVNASRDWALEGPNRFRLVFAGGETVSGPRALDTAQLNAQGLSYVIAAVAGLDRATSAVARRVRERRAADRVAAIFADPPEVLQGVPAYKLLRGYRVATFFVGLITIQIGQQFEAGGLDHRQLWDDELDRVIAALGTSGHGDPAVGI